MSASSGSNLTKSEQSTILPLHKDSLYQVRLLSAFRSGDPAVIHTFLTEISDQSCSAAALHLAIRCASCDTVAQVLSHREISPNSVYPPGSGTTALHLAASLAREDVVNLLLEQEGIDDSLKDNHDRTALEVAKGKECIRAIKDSRAMLTASYRSLLRTYILSPSNAPPPDALVKLLESPRIHLVDLSYIDDASGRTLLHEAARRKDLKLVELAVRGGADVFVRDRKGRSVAEGAGKDDKVRVFLKQFANNDMTLINIPSSEPPELKGYLNKYTNVAKGYSTRWFVLRNGTLAYFRHQEDEGVASRGSIAMKTATIHVSPGSMGLRFEVHSAPTRHNTSPQKWFLKANHPLEASRWVHALQKAIEWAKRDVEERKSIESDAPSNYASSARAHRSGTATPFLRPKNDGAMTVLESAASSVAEDILDADPTPKERQNGRPASDQDHDNDISSFAESTEQLPPHSNSFELQGNTLVAQAELASRILCNLAVAPDAPTESLEMKKVVDDTVAGVHDMLAEYVQMVREREEWWKKKLERERERQNVWEESLQAVVREGEHLEQELRRSARRKSRIDSSYVTVDETGTVKRGPSRLLSQTAKEVPGLPDTPTTAVGLPPSEPVLARTSTMVPLSLTRPKSLIVATAEDEDECGGTDEEDEFFDAIDSNSLPNLVVNQALTTHIESLPPSVSTEQYAGYRNLRKHLAISSDNRPPMSLWAVLKNSIGKDLTKISFPVFFNEPTSMLQRMAEDMEFSECLDAAFAEEDPHRRIAFVAAFAMSNYSSTIGRIAKPFNPMLSETFEYVRFDREYRYVSEQVSHHPPISACWAESPLWRYYGEVDAQNKFMGKSFEIRPTGVAHAELLLPVHRAPHYPRARGTPHDKGERVVEHYSWKKVTTNVSGFILGSPTIDHYGDMIITNHRTKDQCVLTFKPRGWRGKDAFEISGYVADASGKVTYEIAGRWNSQLVARAVGTGVGQLHPDVAVRSPTSPSPPSEYILLWRNSVKPPAPFNLTPFAITLNDCPEDTLKPYLAPTDCRLRPDQRAFELGRYEHANDLKNKQEEKQRATRKARDEGRLPPHKPRWFRADTEPDTGERVWSPVRTEDDLVEYWAERGKVWQEKHVGLPASWRDVDDIFIDDEP